MAGQPGKGRKTNSFDAGWAVLNVGQAQGSTCETGKAGKSDADVGESAVCYQRERKCQTEPVHNYSRRAPIRQGDRTWIWGGRRCRRGKGDYVSKGEKKRGCAEKQFSLEKVSIIFHSSGVRRGKIPAACTEPHRGEQRPKKTIRSAEEKKKVKG